jgi:uncharacterized protein YndB with AHSA1/START domain
LDKNFENIQRFTVKDTYHQHIANMKSHYKSDEVLAAEGKIRTDAPITATAEQVIDASHSRVWEVLTDFERWPEWMEGVSDLDIDGDPVPKTTFIWKTSGMRITSQLHLVEPEKRISWTGKMLGTRAIHVWHFESLGRNKTLVTTSESMEGWFIRLFFSSEKLKETLKNGLKELQLAAEC